MSKAARAARASLLGLVIVGGATYLSDLKTGGRAPTANPATRPTLSARPVSDVVLTRTVTLGYSRQHRPIVAEHLGDPDSSFVVLIVGCIHGNEPAGIAIARTLAHTPIPPEANLWLVPDINPDGVAAQTRSNSAGVDLNRNFPYRWQPLGPAGSNRYAGSRPLSEPESRLAAALVQRLHPQLSIWYHQALGVVDDSEGPRALERRYAALTGLPLRSLTDYPGSAVGYENNRFGPSAFVVELPGGALSPTASRRHADAVLDLIAIGISQAGTNV